MEWVERTEDQFWPAKRRRIYSRGKRADREALLRYRLRDHLDKTWGDAMEPPFDWGHALIAGDEVTDGHDLLGVVTAIKYVTD